MIKELPNTTQFKVAADQLGGSVGVRVTQNGIIGERPMVAWISGGPAFAALGGGARYALSRRVAFSGGLKLTAALGPSGILPSMAPELSLQYGF